MRSFIFIISFWEIQVSIAQLFCKHDQSVVELPNGSLNCANCSICPPGFGPTVPCGRTYIVPYDVPVTCEVCPPNTYSDSLSLECCKHCSKCLPDEMIVARCTIFSDTRCSKKPCLKGSKCWYDKIMLEVVGKKPYLTTQPSRPYYQDHQDYSLKPFLKLDNLALTTGFIILVCSYLALNSAFRRRKNSNSKVQKPDVSTPKAFRPGYHPGTSDVYNMTAIPRGITLIINNKLFDERLQGHFKDPTRHGSEEDLRHVEALFNALGFKVYKKENLTRPQLLNELDYFACQDHSAYDCFVLWLMSHGKSGEVFCSDGSTLCIQTVHDMFSNCDTLRCKPKLVFIQACRGDEEDEGVTVTVDISSKMQLTSIHVDSPIDGNKLPGLRVPTHADYLFSFSTVDEHVSYRHKALGSYYVRALVETFQEHVVHDHLLDILTIVNQKVSDMEATLSSVENKNVIKVFKQMPEVKHTLRKKVRF